MKIEKVLGSGMEMSPKKFYKIEGFKSKVYDSYENITIQGKFIKSVNMTFYYGYEVILTDGDKYLIPFWNGIDMLYMDALSTRVDFEDFVKKEDSKHKAQNFRVVSRLVEDYPAIGAKASEWYELKHQEDSSNKIELRKV